MGHSFSQRLTLWRLSDRRIYPDLKEKVAGKRRSSIWLIKMSSLWG